MGFNAAVARLFSEVPAFSANVETVLTNKADNSRLSVPMRMLKNGDRFRIEVDFVKMKGAGLAMQGVSAIQNIGMSRMTSLVLPKEKGMVVLFPELKYYTKVTLEEADLASDGYQMTKRQAGRDTINGQACVRQNVVLTAKDGTRTEVTVWENPALERFPVRMLFRPEGASMMMNFSEVQLTAPGEDAFKVPPDYKGFNSIAGLMQEAMTRALSPK